MRKNNKPNRRYSSLVITRRALAASLTLMWMSACATYVPVTGQLMRDRNIGPDELGAVQLYVDKEVRFERKIRTARGVSESGRLEADERVTEVILLERHTPGVQVGCSVMDRDPLRPPSDDQGTSGCVGMGPPDNQRGVRLWVPFQRGPPLPFIAYGNGSFVLDTPGKVARLNEHDYTVLFEGATPPLLVIEEGAAIRRLVRRRMDGEWVDDYKP